MQKQDIKKPIILDRSDKPEGVRVQIKCLPGDTYFTSFSIYNVTAEEAQKTIKAAFK